MFIHKFTLAVTCKNEFHFFSMATGSNHSNFSWPTLFLEIACVNSINSKSLCLTLIVFLSSSTPITLTSLTVTDPGERLEVQESVWDPNVEPFEMLLLAFRKCFHELNAWLERQLLVLPRVLGAVSYFLFLPLENPLVGAHLLHLLLSLKVG